MGAHNRRDARISSMVGVQTCFAGPILGLGLAGYPPVFVATADGTCRDSTGGRPWP